MVSPSALSHLFPPRKIAGKTTTNEELEEMLEQGNSAVFTQGVSYTNIPAHILLLSELFYFEINYVIDFLKQISLQCQ